MEFVVITGMSGAGKSQAMKVMEDMGYYCMDNLPPALLSKFAELTYKSTKEIKKVAIVVDIRGGEFFESLFQGLGQLTELNIGYKILFLDSSDDTLIKRYKELRRPHPLSPEGNLMEGINEERKILKEVKERADYIIDTSKLNIGMLREEMTKIFVEGEESSRLSVSVTSFGFKHGILLDGDLILDVRFIPNPFYIPELKEFTGKDIQVRDYVFKWPQTQTFISKVMEMLEFLIPYYIQEGKTQLVIGIGCTGGKHRSVAIAEWIAGLLKANGHRAMANHRDILK
ncbi:MAG: RNase adapter RapZ [Gudongella sp.]|nr:RNase adapter RapZ [Gudongella sp.]